jgi:hypothetical protein
MRAVCVIISLVCVTISLVCVEVLQIQQYIETSQPNMASKYSPSLTLNILQFGNCSISLL